VYLPFAHYCKTVYQHVWSAYDIPLTIGENVIEITASGASYAPGTASITITRVPSPIQNLKAVPGEQQITLSWDPAPGATSYNVYWSTSRDVGTTNGTLIANVSTPYTHTGLLDNTTYYYVVTAVANGLESDGSDVVWGTPGWLLQSVVMLPADVYAGSSALAVDHAGQAHIHYSYARDTGGLSSVRANLYARIGANGFWNTSYLDSGSYADIALEPPDKPHVSFLSNSNLRHGVVGSALDTVDTATCDASLALDAAGKAHIAYFTDTGLRYATNSSGTWTYGDIKDLGYRNYSCGSVSLSVDSAGVAHVAYQIDYRFGLQYATNAGGAWVISTVWPYDIEDVSLAIDSNGATHMVFAGNGSFAMHYAHNKLGTWTDETIEPLGGGAYGRNPSLSLDAAGKAHVAYFHPESREIRFATNSSGEWHISSIETVDDPLATRVPTDTAIDPQGNVHFVYFTTKSVRYATNK
jgi:hypothetical protein